MLSIASLGCADETASFVGWPADLAELNFVVRYNGDQVSEIFGPHLRGEGGSPTGKIEVTLEDGDGLLLVSLAPGPIKLRSSRIVLDDLARSELVASTDPCESTLSTRGYEELRLRALEPQLRALNGPSVSTELAALILDELSLRVPYDQRASCRPGDAPRFVSFLSDREVPPEDSIIDGELRRTSIPDEAWTYYAASGLAWLDEERLLLSTPTYLYRLTQGGTFDPSPSNVHRVLPPSPNIPGVQAWHISGVAVDPRSIGTGIDRVVVSYGLDPGSSGTLGLGSVWLYVLDEQGMIEGRSLGETPVPLESIAINAQGQFFAGANEGQAYFGTVDDGILQALSIGPGRRDAAIAVQENRSLFGSSFYLITDLGGVFSLKLDGAEVVALDALSTPETLSTPRGFALRPAGEVSPELWVGTYSHGVLRRLVSGAWDRVALTVEPELIPCAAAERMCGRASIEEFVTGIAVRADGRVLLGPSACSAALLLDPETSCIDAVRLGDEPVQRLGVHARFDHVAVSRNGRIAVIGGERVLSVLED